MSVKFYQPENQVPLEMHKVRVVQKLNLLPVDERLRDERLVSTFRVQGTTIL